MFRYSILKHPKLPLILALILCSVFFAAYSVLSIVRHNHYQSFGYDLGINNQVVWRYSIFQLPITTSDPFPGELKLATHVEVVYALIAPFYWIWSSAKMLLLVDAFFLCVSGMAIFLLARHRRLSALMSLALVFSYLLFYGIQNAMWFDVHSASFAAGFIAWFIYFLDREKYLYSWIFLLLALTAKENIGILTLLISIIYFFLQRNRQVLIMGIVSLSYVLFIQLVYFPYIIQKAYLYQNGSGLLSNINPISLIDSPEKREAIWYSFLSLGFIPLMVPLLLLPIVGDFATYFVLASELKSSHGVFMHYRVTLAPLLYWTTILAIARYTFLRTKYVAVYLIISALLVQYLLHLPLSYLTKSWFWTEPSGVVHIEKLKNEFTPDDSIVAQNNLIPHLSRRDKIYTLYPEKKNFSLQTSPCGNETCDWFRWSGTPTYLFVDTSVEWDIRHFLADREEYVAGLTNLEKMGVISPAKQSGSAVIYTVNKNPERE